MSVWKNIMSCVKQSHMFFFCKGGENSVIREGLLDRTFYFDLREHRN